MVKLFVFLFFIAKTVYASYAVNIHDHTAIFFRNMPHLSLTDSDKKGTAIIAAVLSTIVAIVLIGLIVFYCRRRPLPPTLGKYHFQ